MARAGVQYTRASHRRRATLRPDRETMQPLVVAVVTLCLVGLCVLLHFEALNLLARLLPASDAGHHRRVLVLHVLGLLLAHTLEIWVFGLATWGLVEGLHIGRVIGDVDGMADYVYFSAMIYTTVGFGDLVPEGPLRTLAGTEALTGLALITWSASFTFLLMQRIWQR